MKTIFQGKYCQVPLFLFSNFPPVLIQGFQGAPRPTSISIGSFSLVCNVKTKTKKFADFILKSVDFQNLMKIEFCCRFSSSIAFPWGHVRSYTKFGRSVQPFGRLLDIRKQTDRQETYLCRLGF